MGLNWKPFKGISTKNYFFRFSDTAWGVARRDRLVVRTLRCGRSNPGSNPGLGSIILAVLFCFHIHLCF